MIRGVGLRSAVAINVATMVGAGPFITLPLVVVALHGSVSSIAWLGGALIALCDGLVWAELASRYPRSGGTYAYLREAFDPRRAGRFFAFLFVWQFLFWAPLVIASGYIGFAQYAAYLVPALAGPVPTHLLAAAVGVVTLAALYRAIPQIARTALVLGGVALVTLVAVALAGLTHPHAPLAQTLQSTFSLGVALPALGAALVITLYDYSGYADVCALGDEVVAASRTIPRAIVISVLAVAAAYVLLNIGVVSALAPKEIAASTTVASLVAERAFGTPFAIAVTVAVLITAFGSTYGLLLAAARVPYAAARDGDFLAPFARLHPRGRFPSVGLVAIGLLALPASLLPLDAVIAALTAGIVLVQGVAQVFALFVTRRMQSRAPFRVPLFPLPPLIALAGWIFLFFSTGPVAIAFGLGTLMLGAVVFLVRARLVRSWPFGAIVLASLLAFAGVAAPHAASARVPSAPPAAAPAFGHAVVVQRGGEPVLLLDGKPFFFWGASFFYERLPATEWRASMIALRGLGANTLDIYVPWNWHELADGDFDFDGRTNPRRNLREVLRLGKELGFAFIVRPGPVIRNEWRNGGYPAWLLTRPEYGMPLHDVLEGRYPATATLQNAHSDDAAAEWMRNQTHMRYAARWLHRALEEFRPVADRVLAVQLDDDQGAYVDNQTYPAPNLARYLGWLDAQVRTVIGPATPTFINTYAMRVPASSPVWTMGNWYQSDAYAIGEHDRIELDTATAVLRTNHRGPLAQSEFQAGWLAQPEDPQPRAADPHNTELALYELLAWGAHGIVDFPMQDTLAPFGWEAPFSNALYAWDAALHYPWQMYDDSSSTEPYEIFGEQSHWSRREATSDFGTVLHRYGPLLAETHRLADVGLAYPGSSYPGPAAAAGAAALARFREHVRECTDRGTPCEVVDLSYADLQRVRSYTTLVIDDAAVRRSHPGLLAAFVRGGGKLSDRVPAEHLAGSVLSGGDATFMVASNWNTTVRHVAESQARIARRSFYVPSFDVGPRSGRLIVLDARLHRFDARYRGDARATTSCDIEKWRQGLTFVASGLGCEVSGRNSGRLFATSVAPYRNVTLRPDGGTYVVPPIYYHGSLEAHMGSWTPATTLAPSTTVTLAGLHRPTSAQTETYRADVFADGASDVVLQNQTARAVIVPGGGARMPVFTFLPSVPTGGDPRFVENAFDATGALRDDVLIQLPPSPADRIARYTHSYPAGTFNRTYTVSQVSAECVRLTADVPDVVPAGARFDRYVALLPGTARLTVDERVTFAPGPQADQQRGIVLSALSTGMENDGMTTGVLYAGATAVTTAGTLAAPGGVALVRHTAHRLDEHWEVLAVSWRPGDVEDAAWLPQRSNGTLRMVLAPGWRRVTYALARTETLAAALAFAEAERAWAGANPAPASEGGEVAKRYTQSPQKRPSESSCGFESHLPQ